MLSSFATIRGRTPATTRLSCTRGVRPESLAIEGDGEDVLVRFELPAGSYATVVVEELFGPVEDASRAAGSGVC